MTLRQRTTRHKVNVVLITHLGLNYHVLIFFHVFIYYTHLELLNSNALDAILSLLMFYHVDKVTQVGCLATLRQAHQFGAEIKLEG